MRMGTRIGAICLTIGGAGSVLAATGISGTVTVGPDLAVAGTVAGRPARWQLLPNGSSTLVMNPDAAARFGIRAGWFGARVKVGPAAVDGRTAVVRYGVNGAAQRRRIGWFDRPIAPGFDGQVGPAAAPQPVVVFRLRPPVAGEHATVLPLVDRGYAGMGTTVSVGGQPIFVEWALTMPHSGATAAAGATVAAVFGGRFSGRPWREPMAFGVARPVRRVVLAQPLQIGPLRIDSLVTRTSDDGNAGTIPDAEADPDEIVVTGRRKGAKPGYAIEIGTDAMRSCSSLIFDKPRKQIILTCR